MSQVGSNLRLSQLHPLEQSQDSEIVSHPGCDAAQALYRQLVYWTLYSFLRVARCLTLDQMMREPISSQFICPQVFAAKLHRYKYKNHYRSHYIPNINPPEAVKSAPSYIFIQCFQNF